MRCSMLSRMKLHRAVNVAGIVKRKDSFMTAKITAAVKNSTTPPSEVTRTKRNPRVNALGFFFWSVVYAQKVQRKPPR